MDTLAILVTVWQRTSSTFVAAPVATDGADQTGRVGRRRGLGCKIGRNRRRKIGDILKNKMRQK